MVNSTSRLLFDNEKFSINTAWMKKGGEHYEVVIDPDNALEFKRTKGASPPIKECLHAERVFSDAKRGLHANDSQLLGTFGTQDPIEIAKRFILEGEIQLTAEHRAKIREAKRNNILNKIRMYAIDPLTGLPHPQKRIELAMDEAKVKIDDNQDVDTQIKEIVRKLQPIIPIRLETVVLQIHLPSPYGQRLYSDVARFGTIKKSDWLTDGSWSGQVEMPAGLQNDLFEEIGKKTHGGADIKRVGEHRQFE